MQVSILENLETLHKYYSKSLQTGRYVSTYITGQTAALPCEQYVPLKPAGAIKCKCKVDVYARRQRMRKVNKSFQSFDWPATMTQWDQKFFEVTFKVLHPYKRFMRKFYQNCLHVIGVKDLCADLYLITDCIMLLCCNQPNLQNHHISTVSYKFVQSHKNILFCACPTRVHVLMQFQLRFGPIVQYIHMQ